MFGNQIIKQVGTFEKWKNQASHHHYETFIEDVIHSHHFFFGNYMDIEKDLVNKLYNKRMFMDGLANNLKLPYDSFLLCFKTGILPNGENLPEVKYAMLVRRFVAGDIGITVDFLTTGMGNNKWTLFPFNRLYLFNQTLAEGSEYWNDMEMVPLTDGNVPFYKTNNGIFSTISKEQSQEFIMEGPFRDIQQVMAGVLNYFLILYNQKYIVTETIYRSSVEQKRKRNKTRLFDYKILSVQLPKSGKKYRYNDPDSKSNGIMPFSEVPGTWKTYTEEAPMFGNSKLVGDFWIPAHCRGSKQTGFVDKDYHITG